MSTYPQLLDPPVQHIEINGLNLAYRECGVPGQPTLVLLHGLAETSAFFWRPLIENFKDNYHIFAFDLLGHGDSDKPGAYYEPTSQAVLIAGAIRELNLAPVIFVGHSFGGIIAAHISIHWRHLVHKLVLYDTPLPDNPRNNILRFFKYAPLSASVAAPLIIAIGMRAVITSLPIRVIMRLILLSWRISYHGDRFDNEYLGEAERHSSYAMIEIARASFLKTNIIKDLKLIHVPTCVIVGDTDKVVPIVEAKHWVQGMPNAELVIIENAGHVALLDNPEQFNLALEHFLTYS